MKISIRGCVLRHNPLYLFIRQSWQTESETVMLEETLVREIVKHFHNVDYTPRVEGTKTFWKCLCGEEYYSDAYKRISIITAYNTHLTDKLQYAQTHRG
jgi:hypothetical protein